MAKIRNLRHGVLKIKDGKTPTPNALTVVLDAGELRWLESSPVRPVRDRQLLFAWAPFLDEPVRLAFAILHDRYVEETTSGGSPSVIDALRRQGNASGWTSTTGCGPFTMDLEFTVTNPDPAGTDEVITFADFILERIEFREEDAFNMLRIAGRALVTQPAVTFV